MRTTAISPDGYRRPAIRYDSGIAMAEAAMPSRPAPSNVTDGRFYGDDGDMWSMLSALPVEANTAETAARVAAVFFCVSLIAEAVGSLSLDFKDDGGLRADFPLQLLSANGGGKCDQPNRREPTSYDFSTGSSGARGNDHPRTACQVEGRTSRLIAKVDPLA